MSHFCSKQKQSQADDEFQAESSLSRLVPLESGTSCERRLGVAKGLFEVPESIDDANEEVAKLFLGGI